ncbi:hypothetical protein AEGHOMDF_4840 [Methylobacterium soli]|nr:hypothetical protein AEGHOMDF_4840 [Methylobacterium soli]
MRWLSSIQPGQRGYAPAGSCRFAEPLLILSDRIAITGDGPYQTIFVYTGTSETVDLITIGDGIRPIKNLSLRDFRVTSSTRMKDGSAIHAKQLVRSMLESLVVDGQDGNGNLWNGIWFDGVDQVVYRSMEARAQADAVRVNGIAGKGNPKADLFLQSGKISFSDVGLRVGGAFGGLYADALNIIANGRGVVIDNSLADEANRELFFGPLVAIDSTKRGAAVTLEDAKAGPASWTQFTGSWVASEATDGVLVAQGVRSTLVVQGGSIFNFKRDGIRNESQNASVFVSQTIFRFNKGRGINNQSKVLDVSASGVVFQHNELGNVEGKVKQ